MKRLLTALAGLALAAVSNALSFDDITNWTGTGSNRAALVIDWNDGTSVDSFVWGYRFDGTTTGATMLQAIVANDPSLEADLVNYGSASAPNLFVSAFSYAGHSAASSGNSYWAYYTSNAGATLPTDWTYSSIGMSDRSLVDGSWDGWSFGAYPNEAAPGTPTAAPVPEPGTFVALGLGAALLRRRRRRSA